MLSREFSHRQGRGPVLEGVALAALIERCVPGRPAPPLAAIVRQASRGEPLVIGLTQNGKPITIVAPSKEDAIAFVVEARVAGQHVRVGLAGLSTRDLDPLGLSLADAFEPCANLRGAARVLDEARSPATSPLGRPILDGSTSPRAPTAFSSQAEQGPAPIAAPASERRVRDWDVYGRARADASLVYAPPD